MPKKLATLLSLLALSTSLSFALSSPSSPLLLSKGIPVTVPSMAKGTANYYSFSLPANTLSLSVTTTGTTGDADIYLNKDIVRNTKTSTWKSTKSASTEAIRLSSPASGTYFLTLRAYTATTNTVVSLSYTDAATGVTTILKDIPVQVPLLPQAEEKYYTFTVPSSSSNLTLSSRGTQGDADIYLSKDTIPTNKTAVWKSTTNTANESITLSSPVAGTYYVLLRAYTAVANTILNLSYTVPTTSTPATGGSAPVTTTPSTGGGGGSTPVVTTPTVTPVNGSCSTSNGATLSAAPTTNLCTTGTASSVTNSSSYTWSCTGTSGGTTAACSASKTVVATATTYVLTTSATNGTVTGAGTYNSGANVTLTATPSTGYTFSSWTGCTSTTSSCTTSMTSNKTISATFTAIPVAVNGSCGSSNNQTLSSIPTTNLCTTGTASSVTNSSSYTWSCSGTNGGTTASCSAAKTAVVTTPTTGSGLSGSYFPNITLTGTPVLTRTEAVGFDWGQGSPSSGIVGTDLYSVRWTGYVTIPTTGSYQFQTRSDDGVRLYINNALVIDNWTNHGDTTDTSATVTLTAGQSVPVVLEYFEQAGGALIYLAWRTPSTTSFLTIPATSLTTGTVTIPTTPSTPTATTYTLTTTSSNGTLSGSGTYSSGTTATVVATPNAGYTFSSFTGCTTTSGTTCTVAMTSNKTISATFTATVVTPTPVNGTCGSSNNQTLSSIPTTNLCTTGTASSVTNSSSYTWSCTGTNGGTTASCSAAKPVVATPPTSGTISTTITPSRVSGVAPLAVFFDSTQTTSSLTARPFHDLEYTWNFGDSSAGTWSQGSRVGASKNAAKGPVAAHVFETPGTYTVNMTANYGTNTSSSQVTITVTDPNTQFSGANTVCISSSGNFSSCPTGATQVTSNDADASIAANIASGKRILFRAGETFDVSSTINISVNGPGVVGSYGGGRATLNKTASVTMVNLGTHLTPNVSDWRIQDLVFEGNSAGLAAFYGAGSFSKILLNNVDIRNTSSGIVLSGSVLDGLNASAPFTHAMWDEFYVVNSSIFNLAVGNGPNAMFLSANRFAALGNNINNNLGGEHGIRTQLCNRCVISSNTIEGIATGKTNLTIRGGAFGGGSTVPAGVYSEKNVISDNKFVGGNSAGMLGLGSQNGSNDERGRNMIYERNYFIGSPTTQSFFLIEQPDITVRNNLVYAPGPAGGAPFSVKDGGINGTTPYPTRVHIYNNSVYYGSTASNYYSLFFASADVTLAGSTFEVKNNIIYAPTAGSAHILGNIAAGSPTITLSNNTVDLAASPSFTQSPPAQATHFRPLPGSYAIGAGTEIPVWSDFYWTAQSTTRSLGAIIP